MPRPAEDTLGGRAESMPLNDRETGWVMVFPGLATRGPAGPEEVL